MVSVVQNRCCLRQAFQLMHRVYLVGVKIHCFKVDKGLPLYLVEFRQRFSAWCVQSIVVTILGDRNRNV